MDIDKSNKILNSYFNSCTKWDDGELRRGHCSVEMDISTTLPPGRAFIMFSKGEDKECSCRRDTTYAAMPIPDFLEYISNANIVLEKLLAESKNTCLPLSRETKEFIGNVYKEWHEDYGSRGSCDIYMGIGNDGGVSMSLATGLDKKCHCGHSRTGLYMPQPIFLCVKKIFL